MGLLGSWTTDILVVGVVLFGILYYYITATHDYWKRLNVPYSPPSFPFGNFGKAFKGEVSFVQMLDDFYPLVKKKGYAGVYNVREPVLLVSEPELVKHFLTKDFSSFHDRGVPHDEENDPFSATLFSLEGERWKVLRAKLSPTFTSGKIKGMFPLIQTCARELEKCIRKEMKKRDGSVEMKDLLIRYTTDVIGICAFGINCNSLGDPKTKFYQMGAGVFRSSITNTFRFIVTTLFPSMNKHLTLKRLFSKATAFYTSLMDRTVKYRRENNVEKNDFVQMMMKIMDEDDGMSFNIENMAAQAFIFFQAGLDNVANNVGFCLHMLAMDPNLQESVFKEIVSVLNDSGEKMSYEAIAKMDLLSRVIDEGLRMYTPSGVLIRRQTEDRYTIPGTDIELKKGTSVMIPIQSIHNDEKYFPNPKSFDPDRFTESAKAKRHPYTYIPFGEGPRFCIASRFAQLEMRLSLAELVRNFRFSTGIETDITMKMDIKAFGPTPKKGFWLRVVERS